MAGPERLGDQASEEVLQLAGLGVGGVPLAGGRADVAALGGIAHRLQDHAAGVQGVLQVVYGVGDVVGPVHDLGLEADLSLRRALPDPLEDRRVVVVDAVLGASLAGPRVFDGGVQRGAGEVEPGTAAVLGDDLGLQPGQQAQALRVALEASAPGGELVERRLPVVAERRVAEVVGQAGGLHQVGVAAEGLPHLAADLRALQGMGQAGAGDVLAAAEGLPRADDLGLGGEPAEPGAVQHPCPIALERASAGVAGRFRHPPGLIVFVIAMHKCTDFIRERALPCRTTGKHLVTGHVPPFPTRTSGPSGEARRERDRAGVPRTGPAAAPVRVGRAAGTGSAGVVSGGAGAPREVGGGQRVSEPPHTRVARAASSRATGMRNGEQDT